MAEVERPLLAALASAGWSGKSVWDLVNSPEAYPELVSVLFEHLKQPYPPRVRAGIARALAVPGANPLWPLLAAMLCSEREKWVLDGLAVALAANAHRQPVEAVLELVGNDSIGPSRIFLLRTLAKSDDPRAKARLLELADDPDMEAADLRGVLRWDPVATCRPEDPDLFHPVLEPPAVRCLLDGRVRWTSGSSTCPECSTGVKEGIDGVAVDSATWDGQALFVPVNLPGTLLVSTTFIGWAAERSFANLELVPALEYTWDARSPG